MERIKQQVDQLQQQLAGLTPSQKMLVGTLVAIMAITVIWWARYAADGEMVALLEQPLTVEQASQIQRSLSANGIEFRAEGQTIFVQATEQPEALGVLSYDHALPEDTTRHYQEAVGSMGSFDNRQKTDLIIRTATEQSLASTIRRWKGVRDVKVHVSSTYKVGISDTVMPSASVAISTMGNADSARLAKASAAMVASAFAMLEPSAVDVIVDGQIVENGAEEGLAATGDRLVELKAKEERRLEQKLRQRFSYVRGLHVSVTVSVNNAVTRSLESRLDPESKIVEPIETTIESESSDNSDGGEWDDAGFNSNVPITAASVGGGAGGITETTTRDNETVRNLVDFNRTREEKYDEGGDTSAIGCTLSIPLSFITAEWTSRYGGEETPSRSDIEAYEQQIVDEFRQHASTALGLVSSDRVFVSTYASDIGMGGLAGQPGGDPALAAAMDDSAISGLVQKYGKGAAVFALAGVALFLMSSMVKKSGATSVPAVPTSAELAAWGAGESIMLAGGDDLAGEAGGAHPLLIGREIAEDQLQAGQMVEQVQSLVKENPDAAAQLVKRWLTAS